MSSNFPFIKDKILRENLDITFNHIIVLIPLSESKTYNDLAKSSFRKTIIISTASIIEALLLYLLRQKHTEVDLADHKWDLVSPKVLHKVNAHHHIVAGDLKKTPMKVKFDKLNLGQINKFLKDKNVIKETLFDRINKVRELRNEQHIGTHTEIKDYTKKDLEYIFSVAKNVKELFT